MNCAEAIEYIHSVSWLGSKPGLERIRELCRLIGNPEKSLQFIHVAGTNGKGSTSSMLSSVLSAEGYRTGTFTSPYVLNFEERISVDGVPISGEELAEVVSFVRPYAEGMTSHPTEFELITAVGLEYFRRRACDFVVLEAGLGGRLDSTNVIPSPRLAVITGVDLDHTEYLGDSPAEIALEKAGIIKRGSSAVFGEGAPEALDAVKSRAEQTSVPITVVDYSRITNEKYSLDGVFFRFIDKALSEDNGIASAAGEYELSMLGRYQTKNAACALTAIEVLRKTGIRICEAAVKRGLKNAKIPARFEIICRDPLFIYDGGHNPQGVAAAVDNMRLLLGDKPIAVVGVMKDKDHAEMTRMLSNAISQAHIVRPPNQRAMDPNELAEEFRLIGTEAKAHPTVADGVRAAVKEAKKKRLPIIALGSLYMYADVLKAVCETCGDR